MISWREFCKDKMDVRTIGVKHTGKLIDGKYICMPEIKRYFNECAEDIEKEIIHQNKIINEFREHNKTASTNMTEAFIYAAEIMLERDKAKRELYIELAEGLKK